MSSRNPVLPGFHPDPSVWRAGAGCLRATSPFTSVPGVPVLRSSNPVDWKQIGNVRTIGTDAVGGEAALDWFEDEEL